MTKTQQALYNLTTQARDHFLITERKTRAMIKKQHPNLKWYEQADLVDKDPEVIDAHARLLALCDACILIGIECGE